MIFPKKIKEGGHIRVISPARSMRFLADGVIELAQQRLINHGFSVSFGSHVEEMDSFSSSPVESRLADIHEAFSDKSVDAILTVIGGYNSGQLLKDLDYKLIKNNPKILCGFSDITCLQNAITEMTGLVTYYGPHFSSWGMKEGFNYSLEYFLQCCSKQRGFELQPSENWSDDLWYTNQEERDFVRNEGYWILNEGEADGRLVGGHLGSLNSIQGSRFFPSLKDSILFIEDTEAVNPELFDKKLQSMLLLDKFSGVQGLLIGRFQKKSGMDFDTLQNIISTKPELNSIPVIANVDFGHTTPIATLPIGGHIEIRALEGDTKILIIKH